MKIKALSLLMAICMVVSLLPAAAAAEEYPVLRYEEDLTISCSTEAYTYVSFTPETTGSYRFYSTKGPDTKATLCTSDMKHLDDSTDCYEFDHEERWSGSFCFKETLEAGVTYLLGVRIETGDASDVMIRAVCAHTMVKEYLGEIICGERATYQYVCTQCGYSYKDEEYIYHDYEYTTVKEATCLEDGMESKVCVNCGDSGTYTFSGDHDYKKTSAQAPTCATEGVEIYTCTVCGDSYSVSRPMPDHEYGEDLRCISCGHRAQTSGTWEQVSWSFADGVLTFSGEGEMPMVGWGEGWYGDIIGDDLPWDLLPVREVVVESGITSIANTLIRYSDTLEKVVLSETVTSIGEYSFVGCPALAEVNLPEGLTEIGEGAFHGCGLRELMIPASLENVDPFRENDRLERITAATGNPVYTSDEQGVLYSKDMTTLEYFPAAYEGAYVLPASVTEMNRYVDFRDVGSLTAIRVAEGSSSYASDDQGVLYDADMTAIEFFPVPFQGTYVLPASIMEIEDEQFCGSPALEAFQMTEGDSDFYTVDGILYHDSYFEDTREFLAHELVSCPPAYRAGKVTIIDGVDSVRYDAFNNCTTLTELEVPASADISLPLRGCPALQAVWFEEGHSRYYSDDEGVVFNAAPTTVNLSSIQHEPGKVLAYMPAGRTGYYAIPEGITAIAYGSLCETQLSAIRFPSTLTVLGNEALTGSTSVEWLLFTGEYPFVAFQGEGWAADVTAKLYYPSWMKGWKEKGKLDEDFSDITYIPYAQGYEPVWGVEEPENPFTDVPVGSFYAEPVAWAVENNITTGASADSFNPDGQCLRAQVVTFLWRAEGCPEPKSLSNPFVDVKETDFYFKAVLWAVENKITNGSDATHFNPFGVCNRAQVVTFLHRAKGSPAPTNMELPFTDVPAGTWYAEPIAWAVENNITNGLSATQFGPNSPCNRAQVVTFLYRAYVD